MNKVRTRISWKIFLIFVSIILLFTALVYAMLIFFLPQFYYDYKIKQINDYANEVVKAGEADDIEGVEKALNDFMENTNILPILIDSNGNIVYIPNVNMASIKSATSTVVDGTKAEGGTTATDYSGGTETKINLFLSMVKPTISPIRLTSKKLMIFRPSYYNLLLTLFYLHLY